MTANQPAVIYACPNCGATIKKGRKFCSRNCANSYNAKHRSRSGESVQINGLIKSIKSGVIPSQLEDVFVAALGVNGANAVLNEIEEMAIGQTAQLGALPEWISHLTPTGTSWFMPGITIPEPSKKPPTASRIEPDTGLVYTWGAEYISDVRRSSDISFSDIDRLLKLGPCVLASRVKKGPIMSALGGKRKWSLLCSNNKLKAIIEADLDRLLLRYVHDMLMCIDYGAAFGSVIWGRKTAEEIGALTGVGKSTKWWAVDKIEWAHPSSVVRIVRNKEDYSFGGYEHVRKYRKPSNIVVDPMQALIITYDSRFGNMWGQSLFEPVYDFALWYEIVMAAFLRYLRRMSTPVTIVKGPQRGTSKRPDGTRIDNPTYGLLLAGAAAMSSAIYLPSERDLQSGQPLWSIEYLDAKQEGQHFINALQYLGTQIMRGALIGDRSVTQDNDVGSYNAATVHNKLTQIDNDFIFKQILAQLNDYLVTRYGMWNVDYNNPPLARLQSEVIDPDEQEILMKLFATAGNFKMFEGSPLDKVDWEEAFHSIRVPVVDDAEMEELFKENLDRKKQNMKAMAPKLAPGQQPQRPGLPAPQPAAAPAKPPEEKNKEARKAVLSHIADGGMIPALLTPEQVAEIILPKQESITLRNGGGGRPSGRPFRRRAEGEPVKDPEFEKKHPRDEIGRWTEKLMQTIKSVGEELKDLPEIPGGEWEWDNATTNFGDDKITLRGKIELDGITYIVEDGVTDIEIARIHKANMDHLEWAKLNYGDSFENKPVFILNEGHENVPVSFTAEDVFLDTGGYMLYVDPFWLRSPGLMEASLMHEQLHSQERLDDSPIDQHAYMEEALTGMLVLKFCEDNGYPLYLGWVEEVKTIAKRCQDAGMSKQEMYFFASAIHRGEGDWYELALDKLLKHALPTAMFEYDDLLDEYWPGWINLYEKVDDYSRGGEW